MRQVRFEDSHRGAGRRTIGHSILALEGLWQNEYGSQLSLVATGFRLKGNYRSTTGSTGTYRIIGVQGRENKEHARAISLAIAWHSLDGGPGDASWGWTSSLSGQYVVTEGAEQLILNHLLIASTPFSGLCDAGTYLDKLTYRKVRGSVSAKDGAPRSTAATARSLDDLHAAEGHLLKLKIWPDTPAELQGTLRLGEESLEVAGFAGGPVDGSMGDRTALSMSVIDPTADVAMTLSGWLQHDRPGCVLQLMASRATGPANTYLQTTLTPIWFDQSEAAVLPGRPDAAVA